MMAMAQLPGLALAGWPLTTTSARSRCRTKASSRQLVHRPGAWLEKAQAGVEALVLRHERPERIGVGRIRDETIPCQLAEHPFPLRGRCGTDVRVERARLVVVRIGIGRPPQAAKHDQQVDPVLGAEPVRRLVVGARRVADDRSVLRLNPVQLGYLQIGRDAHAADARIHADPFEPCLTRGGQRNASDRDHLPHIQGIALGILAAGLTNCSDQKRAIRCGQPHRPGIRDVVPAVPRLAGEPKDRLAVFLSCPADNQRPRPNVCLLAHILGILSTSAHSAVSSPGR